MAVQFEIKITKEIMERCKNCGIENSGMEVEKNCAIAVALKDIFPDVYVTDSCIFPFGIKTEKTKNIKIALPGIAQQFIKLFDGFSLMPGMRLLLPEFEFAITVHDEVLDYINIDEVREWVKAHRATEGYRAG